MRGRSAGQPANRVFESSLGAGSHAGAAFSAEGQLLTTTSLLQCGRPVLQQLFLRAQAAQKSTRDLILHRGQPHASVAGAHRAVVVDGAADVDDNTIQLVGLRDAPAHLLEARAPPTVDEASTTSGIPPECCARWSGSGANVSVDGRMRRGRCARVRGVRRWGEGGRASSGDECKGAASG